MKKDGFSIGGTNCWYVTIMKPAFCSTLRFRRSLQYYFVASAFPIAIDSNRAYLYQLVPARNLRLKNSKFVRHVPYLGRLPGIPTGAQGVPIFCQLALLEKQMWMDVTLSNEDSKYEYM